MHIKNGSFDNEPGAAGPWYARMANAVLRQGGPIALLAVAFAAFLMVIVWMDLRTIKQELALANQRMSVFATQATDDREDAKILLEKQLRIMQQVCVNGAKTEVAMESCLK